MNLEKCEPYVIATEADVLRRRDDDRRSSSRRSSSHRSSSRRHLYDDDRRSSRRDHDKEDKDKDDDQEPPKALESDITCRDSDEGKNIFLKGRTRLITANGQVIKQAFDNCEGKTLNEYYCDYNRIKEIQILQLIFFSFQIIEVFHLQSIVRRTSRL